MSIDKAEGSKQEDKCTIVVAQSYLLLFYSVVILYVNMILDTEMLKSFVSSYFNLCEALAFIFILKIG
jgi:hypothetical protein